MKSNKTQKEYCNSQISEKLVIKMANSDILLNLKPKFSLLPTRTFFLVDPNFYGRSYSVKDGELYTIKLGIVHSNSQGVGIITESSRFSFSIPYKPNKNIQIAALFGSPQIDPAMFLDYVNLHAEQPFIVNYMYHSIKLNSNNNCNTLSLSDKTMVKDNDILIMHYDDLKGKIPECYSFLYDFISFQVQVHFI